VADYYTIAQVVGEPDEWEHDDYGWFNQFTLQFEGVEGVVQLNKKQTSPEPEVGEVLYGNIIPSGGDFPPKFKTEKDPAKKSGTGGGKSSSGGARRSSGGGGGKGGYSEEDLRAIRRNEAQGKAAQWLIFKALAKQTPRGSGADGEFMLTADFLAEGGLVDLFVQDVSKAQKGAKATTSPELPPTPTPQDSPPPQERPSETNDDDDIPF